MKQLITSDDLKALNVSFPDSISTLDDQSRSPVATAANSRPLQNSIHKLAYDGQPTIKLDWLDDGNNEFTLHDIHLHWGERKDNGSEHAIDGKRAAMEVSWE